MLGAVLLTGLRALILAVLLSATAVAADSLEDLALDLQMIPRDGQLPPAFTLPTLDGKRVSLSDFKGRVVLLYFWASW